MALGSLANQFDNRLALSFRGSSVLQQSYPIPGYAFWTPAALFNNGEQGVWYDPSDLTTMFEDSLGTTAVHKPGNGSADSPVGLLLDKHSNGVGVNGVARYNILNYSEDITNAYWNKTASSTTANSITAPDGTTTADTLTDDSTSNYHYIDSTNFTSSAVSYTYSVCLKQGTLRYGGIHIFDGGTARGCSIDLQTGTLGTPYNSATATATNLGNGWYRLTVTATTAASAGANAVVYLSNSNALATYTGTGTGNIYVWGADFRLTSQVALTPTYQPITSSWSATMPGNHALQSTSTARPTLSAKYNQLTYTEQFDNAAWVKSISTITANNTTDPLGGNTADKFAASSSGISSYIYQTYSPAITSGSNCTYSIYAKAGDIGYFTLGLHGQPDVFFDIAGLTYRNAATPGSGFVSASIVSVGNGWVKASATWTKDAGTVYNVYTQLCSSLSSFSVVSGNYIYIWGADLRVSNDGVGLPTYQRVVDANTYDSVGFPYYLKADGVDDYLDSASIDFTSTKVITAFSGLRHLVIANSQMAYALGGSGSYNGDFTFWAPFNAGKNVAEIIDNSTNYLSGASSQSDAIKSIGVTNVYDFTGSTNSDKIKLRINAANDTLTFTGGGTVSNRAFGTRPISIFRPYGASFYYNGRLYNLIVRGASSTATQITNAESWLNGVAKIY